MVRIEFETTTYESEKLRRCSKYDKCSANICPLWIIENVVWYPMEEICENKTLGGLPWIKNQRKIALRSRNTNTYYTLRMLQQNCMIKEGITGLDPDLSLDEVEKEEKKWLNSHRVKKELSPEKRIELSERGKKALKDFHNRNMPIKKQAESVVL